MEKEKKLARFKTWFFKGRIEKAARRQDRIDILSREYDEGKVLEVVR